MEKINLVELLKDCPKGMELDCTMFDGVTLDSVLIGSDYPIKIVSKSGSSVRLTKYGQYADTEDAKCIIYPKGKTTWEEFQRPFRDGDILFVKAFYGWIFIYKESKNEEVLDKYVATENCHNHNYIVYKDNPLCSKADVSEIRFATEEEKERLFQTIKDNGYKWNPETKTLEKLVKPKFKVGDRVKLKCEDEFGIITEITDYFYTIKNKNHTYYWSIKKQDEWTLVSNKFDINTLKPFESRVLVRNFIGDWEPAFWGYRSKGCKYPFVVAGGNTFVQCIPYEGNEHLLGTSNDCDEYYNTWDK